MNKIIVVLALILALATANSAHAEFRWRYFGVAPYAATRAEAMRTRKSAFQELGLPPPVVALFMKTTEKRGEKIRLTVGDRLAAMLSTGGIVHKDVRVDFITPPVSGKMEYAAPAQLWQVSWHGKIYRVILPEICNNWSTLVPIPIPVSAPAQCVELTFDAPIGGHVRWGVGSTDGPLPPSACNAERQGSGAWTAWTGECDTCTPALQYIRGILGSTAEVPHKYMYPVTATTQTLRFSTAIRSRVVYLCLEYPDGSQTCGVYMRPQDWRGRKDVIIPDALWLKDNGKCPQ